MVFRHIAALVAGPARSRFTTLLAATTALSLPFAAVAGDITVTTSTTAPLKTSTGDGSGPGNITVDTSGTITVSSGVPVTVDSSNNATISGTLRNDAASGATGLLVTTTDAGNAAQTITSTITLNGLINIPGPSTATTTASGNVGLKISGLGTLAGSFTSSTGSQIAVGGREAIGISIDSIVNGSITSASALTLAGGGSIGIRSTKAITGSFAVNGAAQLAGQDSIGVLTGNIGGAYVITTTIATGTTAYFDSTSTRVEAVHGGPAAWVAGSVGSGILLQGNQYTLAQESTTTVPTDAPTDSVLASEGTAFGAFRIGPNTFTEGNLVVGVRDDGPSESVTMRGRVQSTTSTLGKAVTAMAITGGTGANGQAVSTILQGGVINAGGNIDASSVDGTATGFEISARATVPFFTNNGDFIVSATDSGENVVNGITTGGGNATGITISSDSTLKQFINTGNFTINARGRTFTATGIIDNGGQLTSFSNSGTFQAVIKSGSTGKAIAADLSKSLKDIDFSNSGTILGDIYFGAGNDTFTSTGGTVTGNISLGSGNNTVALGTTTYTGVIDLGSGNHNVTITNNSNVAGSIIRGTGQLVLNVNSSTLTVANGGRIQASDAYFSGPTKVVLNVTGANINRPLIDVSNLFTIESGVTLTTNLSGVVTQNETLTVINAGVLRMNVPLSQLATNSNSYIYGFQYRLNPTNQNQLLLDVTRRTATQLGLAQNIGTVYETSLTAMAKDNELFATIAGAADKSAFETIVSQLKPDSSDATLYAALRSQNLAYGVIRNRLGGIPRTTGPSAGKDYSSFWVQQLGSYGERDADAATEQPGYKIYTVGIATGFDEQFTDSFKGGMSLAQVWSLPDEIDTRDRPMRISSTQMDFYGRHQNGQNFTQAILGGSYNTYRSERRVVTGTIEREPIGSWKGFNMGGAVDTGTQLRFDQLRFTPYMRAQYVRVHEGSYTETGGGDGVNLDYDSRDQDSLRGGLGFVAERRFVIFQDVGIETALRGDYAREFSPGGANVSARFAAGGATFTQVGQKLDKNVFGLGASIGVRDIFTAFSVDYDAEKSGDFLGHTLAATFRFRF
ncbi:MAG: autotransporter domain-containing protein [Rhodospirillaceae bacterium]|nr:autotransporter domain-containing protein [Rhodospirillaceae bacterium]